jgi:hypothetical protein
MRAVLGRLATRVVELAMVIVVVVVGLVTIDAVLDVTLGDLLWIALTPLISIALFGLVSWPILLVLSLKRHGLRGTLRIIGGWFTTAGRALRRAL